MRRRKNLTILPRATASEIVFDGKRAVGVKATVAGQAQEFRAREIVLCGGGIQSPALLMRSGIGPAPHLREHGIDVRADLSGVGQNLQNHPVLFIGAHLRPASRQPAALRTLQVSCFRLSSGLPGCPETDLCINLQSKSSWSALGAQLANLGPVLWKPFSRGQVTLVSKEAGQHPLVEFNFVDDERDLARMKHGFRFVVELLASESVRRLCGKPFPVRFTDRLRRLNQKTPRTPGNPRSSRSCSISARRSATTASRSSPATRFRWKNLSPTTSASPSTSDRISPAPSTSAAPAGWATMPMRSSTLPGACAASKACASPMLP